MKRIAGLIIVLLALAACGKEERAQLGIDGYVWIPQQIGETETEEKESSEQLNIWTEQTMPCGFKTSGEWLYYVQLSENGDSTTIYRIPQSETLDFSQSEILVSVHSLGGYTVDQDQNLYYYIQQSPDSYINPESGGVILYCQSSGKEILYEMPLEGTAVFQYGYTDDLAAGAEGELFFLMDGKMLRIDGKGNVIETVPMDKYRDNMSWMKEYLLETSEGNIYYVNIGDRRKVWKCDTRENMQFEEVPVLKGYSTSPSLYRNMEGILIADNDGTLYQYQEGQEALQELLRWEDSDMYVSGISEIVVLDEEKMLLLTDDIQKKELYLLKRTSADELPERERIILASLFPTDALRRAVVEFNRINERYHVSIESYGADSWYAGVPMENEAAYTRLDAAISSGSNGPAILDLTYLDIYKYTDKGALEDLSSYMEAAGFKKEDFLDNLQESFTIGGKLVSIPKYFTIRSVAGRVSQAGEKSGWTMEELMKIAAGQQESEVANGQNAQSMIGGFLTGYYLNAFIDWKNGECRFDDERFRVMMEWIKDRIGEGSEWISGYLPENVLLEERELTSFSGYMTLTERFQEEIILKGYPSADGKPVHKASVIDALSILAHSDHKEGAWEFLNFYLSKEEEGSYYFPTRKSLLQAQAEDAAAPLYVRDSKGNLQYREDGSYVTRTKLYIYVEGKPIPADCIPREQVDALLNAIQEIDFTPESAQESEIVEIVSEEAAYFFNSVKSLDEVIEIIQSRVDLVIQASR